MARRLQNRLALAQFKTKHGWEDLTLDSIEPKFENEIRRRRMMSIADGVELALSDSSSSGSSELLPPAYSYTYTARNARTTGLMSSPLKPPLFSSSAGVNVGPTALGSIGLNGSRKRNHFAASYDGLPPLPPAKADTPNKRTRGAGGAAKGKVNGAGKKNGASAAAGGSKYKQHHVGWKDTHQLAQTSPVRPMQHHHRSNSSSTSSILPQQHARHFTTTSGPDISFFPPTSSRRNRRNGKLDSSPAVYTQAEDSDLSEGAGLPGRGQHLGDEDEDERVSNNTTEEDDAIPSSPPRTPPPANIPGGPRLAVNGSAAETPDEGAADLLIFLKTTPSPAVRAVRRGSLTTASTAAGLAEPATPPPRRNLLASTGMAGPNPHNNNLDLPSSMLNTPGPSGLLGFPNTPGQAFDFADFVNITPSPAQKPWRTPGTGVAGVGRTPRSVATRRRLTYEQEPVAGM